ncbi:hypothetical protein SAMN06265360_14611 [Haloechinothrix alba]|uniref:Uncharacterized protein n=1 Tax=Haloechinothrix alba TaxID=664784 RepID=A0A239AMQ5_9PSEU|nr:hypothetical protein SAMN06265360_14611 [Haloechinothrix alba]
MVKDLRTDIDKVFDLRGMVVSTLIRDKALMVKLIRDIAQPEMTFIVRAGLGFGFGLGFAQALVWAGTHLGGNPCVLVDARIRLLRRLLHRLARAPDDLPASRAPTFLGRVRLARPVPQASRRGGRRLWQSVGHGDPHPAQHRRGHAHRQPVRQAVQHDRQCRAAGRRQRDVSRQAAGRGHSWWQALPGTQARRRSHSSCNAFPRPAARSRTTPWRPSTCGQW